MVNDARWHRPKPGITVPLPETPIMSEYDACVRACRSEVAVDVDREERELARHERTLDRLEADYNKRVEVENRRYELMTTHLTKPGYVSR